MIKNIKTVDPADPASPEVIQIETDGRAIEVFEGAALIEVQRDRFVPVKTTNDLPCSGRLGSVDDARRDSPGVGAVRGPAQIHSSSPTLTGGPRRSLLPGAVADQHGDWTFGAGVTVVGDAVFGF
jgi:UTP--glucose-1-phosphate uridylyltransferase